MRISRSADRAPSWSGASSVSRASSEPSRAAALARRVATASSRLRPSARRPSPSSADCSRPRSSRTSSAAAWKVPRVAGRTRSCCTAISTSRTALASTPTTPSSSRAARCREVAPARGRRSSLAVTHLFLSVAPAWLARVRVCRVRVCRVRVCRVAEGGAYAPVGRSRRAAGPATGLAVERPAGGARPLVPGTRAGSASCAGPGRGPDPTGRVCTSRSADAGVQHHARMASPAPRHPADSHDRLRVQGARVNNLRDVSLELPKRRLTVFTGVSGSGKSSLVFGTLAAESQRLLNETHSAFVQGFLPTVPRPDVDLHRRAHHGGPGRPASARRRPAVHRGHRDRRRRAAAHPVQPARAAARRPAAGLLVQRALDERGRCGDGREGGPHGQGATQLQRRRRHVPALRGTRVGRRHRPHRPVRRGPVAGRGRHHRARLLDGRLVRPHLPRLRLVRPGQAGAGLHQQGARRPPLQGGDEDQGRRRQPHLPRAGATGAEVAAVQGRRGAPAAPAGLRRAGRHVPDLPGLRRHPADRGGPVLEGGRPEHRRRLPPAGERARRVGPGAGRAVGGAAAAVARRGARRLPRDRPGLPDPGAAGRIAVRRRGAADPDGPPPRLGPHRRHVRVRRADRGTAPARRPRG